MTSLSGYQSSYHVSNSHDRSIAFCCQNGCFGKNFKLIMPGRGAAAVKISRCPAATSSRKGGHGFRCEFRCCFFSEPL